MPGFGARALALGGAFVGQADDWTASFWNPAGLAGLEGKGWGFSLDQSGLPGEAQGFTLIPNPTSWYFPLGFAYRWREWLIEGSFAFLWGLDRQGRGDIHQNDKIMSLSFSRAFLEERR